MTIPSCSTYSQFVAWQEANTIAARSSHCKPAQFCEDCTKEYQREMVKTDRCDRPSYVIPKDQS